MVPFRPIRPIRTRWGAAAFAGSLALVAPTLAAQPPAAQRSAARSPAAQPVVAPPVDEACAGTPLVVTGGDARDLSHICAGAAAALAFLAAQGLVLPPRIEVAIVDRMPEGHDRDAAGAFDPVRGRVVLLDHARFERFGAWLGRPIDDGMHRAIAAHEVAHAVAADNAGTRFPDRIASEYVAYVTMFATMDPAFRAHVLERHADAPWAAGEDPTEAEYAADPLRFGARAWRHWLRQDDPAAALRSVLEGRPLGAPVRSAR